MSRPDPARAAPRRATPAAEPQSLHERAFDNLRYIRETMDRTASFTSVSGVGHAAAGLTALAAAVAGSRLEGEAWLWLWLAEAAVGVALTVGFSVRKARRAGESLTRGSGRKFVLGFLPPAAAAVALTPALVATGAVALLPGVWLLLYGAAITTAGAFSVRAVPTMGVAFMAVGMLALALPDARDLWLGLGFGGVHLVFGGLIARRYGG